MEEEFQGGVCGGSWWNPSRNLFGSSPCSASEWLNPSLILDTKAAKAISGDSGGSASDGASSVVLQETPISQPQFSLPMGSSFHMMADDWNQDLLNDSARSEQNYSLNSSINCRHEWTTTTTDFSADSSPNSFRLVQQQQQQPPNTYSTSAGVSPLNTASYNYTSSLLHTLFDADSQPLLGNEATDFRMSSAAAVPTFSGAAATKPSFPKQQLVNNYQFINSSTNFWNATAAACPGEVRASFLPSSTPQLIPSALTKPKHTQQILSSKNRYGKGGEADSAAKRCGNEGALKRPRIETPSPLPTFKVRKEKLGDRVTALQQLVSPFGKTDTASVLHEAIDYIKLLHDQVTVLSTPYLKNGPPPLQRQQASDKMKDEEEAAKDLRSRGLCLVPISSTFPMATETTADFWTPTFGASFR